MFERYFYIIFFDKDGSLTIFYYSFYLINKIELNHNKKLLNYSLKKQKTIGFNIIRNIIRSSGFYNNF